MKPSNVALNEIQEPVLPDQEAVIREINSAPPPDLPVVDLIELYVEIESAIARDQGLVVQFVSATSGYESEQIALNMAWASASMLGKRMLLVNCAKPRAIGTPKARIEPYIGGPNEGFYGLYSGMTKVAGYELYVSDLRGWLSASGALVPHNQIDRDLERFGPYFDMIVIVAPPADVDPLGAVLARHVDGNIIVIEAEHTRRAAAIRLREVLSRSGRPIIGTILNNRRNYIPHWIAGLF